MACNDRAANVPGIDTLTNETAELLQSLIRNRCVNDGTPESGEEVRNSDLLETYLEGAGVELERFDPIPGRRSLVSRIEGTDPSAPSVCLMGHTDVVPVSPDGWSRDPFGGDIVDGEIWGRGAVDMLNLTASMAVAYRHLVEQDFKPKGDLVFFAVADEEAGGVWGAEWMAEHHWDVIAADYVLTENGGIPRQTPNGRVLTVAVAEKGLGWRRLKVRGTPGHGSMPYGTDNALITAAEVVRRLADYRPAPVLHDLWTAQIESMDLEADLRDALRDSDRVYDAISELENPNTKKLLHACAHTTFSPNVMRGGVKTNVIPDEVVIEVDIRTIPGESSDDVDRHLREALGALHDKVEVETIFASEASYSPADTPMWSTLRRHMRRAHPDAELHPQLVVGGTDARFYRAKGSVAYGAGLYSAGVTWETFAERFHGHDERIDVESLGLTTQLWLDLAHHNDFWD